MSGERRQVSFLPDAKLATTTRPGLCFSLSFLLNLIELLFCVVFTARNANQEHDRLLPGGGCGCISLDLSSMEYSYSCQMFDEPRLHLHQKPEAEGIHFFQNDRMSPPVFQSSVSPDRFVRNLTSSRQIPLTQPLLYFPSHCLALKLPLEVRFLVVVRIWVPWPRVLGSGVAVDFFLIMPCCTS